MSTFQSGILAGVPYHARFLTFSLSGNVDPMPTLEKLAALADGQQVVVGLGLSTLMQIGASVEGLRLFPTDSVSGIDIPSTPAALWCWLRGDDPGVLLHLTRKLEDLLAPTFILDTCIDAYRYQWGVDLTGYEDGTENPAGEEAEEAAFVGGDTAGLSGSSFVAVQQWLHDLDHFQSLPQKKQDHTIGRRRADNEELDDAPANAHVKRAEQESFTPEAFILRRSMPWHEESAAGLVFVAFGKSLDAYEAILNKMLGKEDGIQDALFSFTRPITGAYFWCPPVRDGHLDLSLLQDNN
jgi:putative iron-dependent peroxidase